MKKLILTFIIGFTGSAQAARTAVSVHEFEDKAGDSQCRYDNTWWYRHLGSAFKEMLTAELSKQADLEVLERQGIQSIYDNEHELVNSEKAKRPGKGKFKIARFVINGAVSDFEYCGSDTRAGVDVGRLAGIGSLRIGGAHGVAKVGVDIRIIDVETGSIIQSVHGKGEAKAMALNISSDIVGEDTAIRTRQNEPITKAARLAIADAVRQMFFQAK